MNDASEIHARPKIIGARVKRTEDPRLLTGLGAYTDDRQVMRVLHVAFRRSDQSHARIRAIDCSKARAAPGVVAVFTAEDLRDLVKPLVATSRMANYYATPILPLARGKVRYVGEAVVGIVAESRYHAEDALELVTIDYEPLPVVTEAEQAVRPGAPLLHEEAGTNVLVGREFKRGDADAGCGFERGRVVFEVDIDRFEPARRRDHRDVRRAQLVDPHAQHQLVVLEHLLRVILADLRRHLGAPLGETVTAAG